MKHSIIAVVLKFLILAPCFSQEVPKSGGSQQDQTLFAKGIYLENKQILIPWDTNYEDIMEYGNPKVINVSRKVTQIKWDSVRILNGIPASLVVSHSPNANLKKASLHTIFAQLNASDVEKVKSYLEQYSQKPGSFTKTKQTMFYSWVIDGCNVRLEKHSSRGSSLGIQKL